MSKLPRPQFITDYYKLIINGPPKCCHSCDNYNDDGICTVYNVVPPENVLEILDICKEWREELPF
jgi:hypothetical protein